MADILLDNQVNPSTPSTGKTVLFVNTTTKQLTTKNDAGTTDTVGGLVNFSTANQTGFASDTNLAGSNLSIPPALARAGTTYHLRFDMAKTGAGTAAAVLTIRFGTAGTTSDAARLTFTFGAGTANADTGMFEAWVHFRNVGGAAVITGVCICTHLLAATGLISTGASGAGILAVTSGTFDSTVASSIISASFNGGASFSGTNTLVQARLLAA
jgi:hypothetical protein